LLHPHNTTTFLFPCYGRPRDLHSFPTRRSSDLPGQGSQKVGMGKDLAERYPSAARVFEEANDAIGVDLRALCFDGPQDDLDRTRSEEHTSELQSRFDLVCRLLLEKKKEIEVRSV